MRKMVRKSRRSATEKRPLLEQFGIILNRTTIEDSGAPFVFTFVCELHYLTAT